MVSNDFHEISDMRYYILRGALSEGKSGKEIMALMSCSKSQVSKLRKKWKLSVKDLKANPIIPIPQQEEITETPETSESIDEIPFTPSTQDIPDDLLIDIKKIKAVMDQFGDKVRLSEVQSYLKEMNQLKPSREEAIKDSLRTLTASELTAIILPTDMEWIPQPALTTTMDSAELSSLIEESDL